MKIEPEAFPTAILKISAKITTNNKNNVNFGLQLLPRGREPEVTFSNFLYNFRVWGTLGGQNGPKTPPKSLRDRGPRFHMNLD